MTSDPILPPQRVRRMQSSGLWPGLRIDTCFTRMVHARPDAVAVVDHNSETGNRTRLSYKELEARVMRIAASLYERGIRSGDVVAVQLPNWWEFVATHLACARLGAITNPLMPIFRERELAFMLDLAQARALIVPSIFRGFDHFSLARSLQGRIASLQHLFAVGGSQECGFEAQLLEQPRPSTVVAIASMRHSADEVVQILYTSGTTGEPKGVMHTSNTLFANIVPYVRRLGLGENDVVLMASPLAHQTGFMYGMMLPVYLGCKAVLQDIWRSDQAARIMAAEGVTYTMGSTPFLSDLNEQAAQGREPFSTLRIFHSAGATIPRQLVRDATERLGATIISGWGMTENGAVATTRPTDPPEKIFETDGLPMDGMEVRVVDFAGNPLPAGETGALEVRGCSNFVGYLHRPEQYATDDEGWFATGDLARLDSDGYVRITGRSKDVVIRGGENIPVVEIEGLLFKHPAVREVAIVGRVDTRLGERCAAWVVPRGAEAPLLSDLTTYLEKQGVSKTYFPEYLRIVQELPKTPSGKIQKFELRAREAHLTD
jgi:cyclohexanecarboxylate-CoA ligase